MGLPDALRRSRSRAPRRCSQEINGWDVATGDFLDGYTKLKDDGSTVCGCWIYCGVYKDGVNQAARKKPHWEQSYVAPEWAWAWPANRRILYNRASADPRRATRGRSARSYVWWDAERGEVDGPRRARLRGDEAARLRAARRRRGRGRDRRRPPVHHAGRRPRLARSSRRASRTGRCRRTTSRTSRRSRTRSTRSARTRARQQFERPENPYNPVAGEPGEDAYPYVADDLPADRAPHRRRDVALRARTSPSSSRRCSARCSPELAAEARPRARRLGDDLHRALGDRGARARDRPDPADRGAGPHDAPGRPALPLGLARPDHGRRGQRPLARSCSTRTCHIQEVKAFSVRHPAGPAAARRGAARVRRAGADARARGARGRERVEPESVRRDDMSALAEPTGKPCRLAGHLRRGREAARRLLHRHVGLHRLQGLRGRLQGVEPRARGRLRLDGRVVRQHLDARREHVAPRRVRRAGQAAAPRRRLRRRRRRCRRRRDRRRAALADELRRLQALHARRLPRRLPDRRALPHRVRHGRRPAGRLQRLRLLRARVPVRRPRQAAPAAALERPAAAIFGSSSARRRTAASGSARSATTGSRAATSRRARRRARPTRSSSGRSTSCASGPRSGSRSSRPSGWNGARLYGHDPDDGVGGFGAFFLLLDEPEVYGLPPDPVVTTRDLPEM